MIWLSVFKRKKTFLNFYKFIFEDDETEQYNTEKQSVFVSAHCTSIQTPTHNSFYNEKLNPLKYMHHHKYIHPSMRTNGSTSSLAKQRTSTITITTVFIQIKVSWPRSRLQVDYITGPPTPSHFRLLTCIWDVCGEVYNLMCFFVRICLLYTRSMLIVSENHGMWYETD